MSVAECIRVLLSVHGCWWVLLNFIWTLVGDDDGWWWAGCWWVSNEALIPVWWMTLRSQSIFRQKLSARLCEKMHGCERMTVFRIQKTRAPWYFVHVMHTNSNTHIMHIHHLMPKKIYHLLVHSKDISLWCVNQDIMTPICHLPPCLGSDAAF